MRHVLAALAACLAVPVGAENSVNLAGTIITLQPGEWSEAVVDYRNRAQNSSVDDSRHELTMDGLTVGLEFIWDAPRRLDGDERRGSYDRIVVTPPEGWACEPASCRLDLPEHGHGSIELFRSTVGM